jgi:1-acyl-sn-glycerol-3-phosphate acyltransferase
LSREPVWWVAVRVLDLVVRAVVDLRIVGLDRIPPMGAALLAANHVSFLDPVVVLVTGHRAGRKVRFLAVQEAFERPVSGWFLRVGRHIPVAEGAGQLRALRAVHAALADGELVLVYPEGTIAAAPGAAARRGAGWLAVTGGVPVVPIGTAGLERRKRAPRLRRRRARVFIGAPVALDDLADRHGRTRDLAVSDRILAAVRDLEAAAASDLHPV